MLRLLSVLTGNFATHQKQLNQIKGCPCLENTILAFDLNSVKVDFCQDKNLPQMRSVNALVFAKSGRILLIEFKQSDPDRLAAIRCTYFIQAFTNELPAKITGSKQLFGLVCDHNSITHPEEPINSIFLVNLKDQDYLTYMANSAMYRGISFAGPATPNSAILNCKWFDEYMRTA